ncbi:MAG: LysR family transcriptional regulator [Ilumatobacteraceae bacterium]
MALDPAPTTFERLRILAAIESAGTIAGAARSLGYTPSAVSQHLAALEREAGVALAERSNRGIRLTAAGARLAGRAGSLLDDLRNAFDELRSTDERAELRVAAFPTAIAVLLLPLRERLADAVRLTVVHAEPGDALRLVLDREVDAALTDGLIAVDNRHTELLHRSLVRTERVVLVRPAGRRVRSLADCAESPWVLGGASSRTGQATRRLCREAGFEPDVIAETEDHHVTFEVMRATGAVSVLPELALTSLPSDIAAARSIDLGLGRRIELVTRPRLATNPAIRTLERALRH